jgi:hypothetical protein
MSEPTFEHLRDAVLGNYDVAFKLDWERHGHVHRYINSMTMYCACKLDAHFGSAGSFLAYRFNERDHVEDKVELFRSLTRNEFRDTFSEEQVGGCRLLILG